MGDLSQIGIASGHLGGWRNVTAFTYRASDDTDDGDDDDHIRHF